VLEELHANLPVGLLVNDADTFSRYGLKIAVSLVVLP